MKVDLSLDWLFMIMQIESNIAKEIAFLILTAAFSQLYICEFVEWYLVGITRQNENHCDCGNFCCLLDLWGAAVILLHILDVLKSLGFSV